MRNGGGILCAILSFICFSSCHGSIDNSEEEEFVGEYIAHVQLDSTMLVATEVINNLEVPWDIIEGPEGWIWYNEQRGTVSRVNPNTGETEKLLVIPDVHFQRSRGLLSMAISSNADHHPFVFFHYIYLKNETEDEAATRIVRYTFRNDTLTDRQIILDNLPGGTGHNGSRMVITPDEKLWVGTGDALRGDLAQNPKTYHGKVLRMNLDGSVPEDNPFEDSHVWTTGHRNIQGITFAGNKIFVSEHGPDSNDEVNLLKKGRNYGWPDVMGYCDQVNEMDHCRDSLVVEPLFAWTPVIAPAGLAYYDHDSIPEWKNSLLLASLRIQTMRELEFDDKNEEIRNVRIFFQQYFGRLRDVTVSRDGKVFLATSNMDWYKDYRPEIHDSTLVKNGDRIIMLQRENAQIQELLSDNKKNEILIEDLVPLYLGDAEITDEMKPEKKLFLTYCSSCHGIEGQGKKGYVPGLNESKLVSGSKDSLIHILLNGISNNDKNQSNFIWEMPAYSHMDDESIADILNYIRVEFANKTDIISRSEVTNERDFNE